MSDMPSDDVVVEHDGITWHVDQAFLRSNWTCLWGNGCQGILDQPSAHLQQGCCSVGAELADVDEAMTVAALADTLSPDAWQFRGHSAFNADRTNTNVVDGACVFLNRPGFAGGAGCALHLAAVAHGESPIDWKPSVCWQLPIRVDWTLHDDGTETARLRRWRRADWGAEGETMAWCCTEAPDAYIGDRPVVESLADELHAVLGHEVWVQVRRRVTS
jgi:hypothetical protein